MKRVTGKLNSVGFTMAETLTVVAIIVILMAVAIPSVLAIRSNLHMKELDDTARQIYLAAQNRMTAMKASGRLSDFQDEMDTDFSDQKVSPAPADYESGDENWTSLYYLSSGDAAAQTYLLEEDSVLVSCLKNGASYMLEINPTTGDVYSVFYAEQSFGREQIAYLDDTIGSRDRGDRRDVNGVALGYYCGSAELSASAALPAEFKLDTPEIVNKEDLYMVFTCSGIRGELRRYIDHMDLTVTVEDAHGHSAVRVVNGASFTTSRVGQIAVPVLLDSIDAAKAYQGFTGAGSLTPGDDLTISARLTYQKDKTSINGELTGLTVNSSFESRTDNADGSVTVQVSAVRHLSNLRRLALSGKTVQVLQTADLNFDGTTWTHGERLESAGTGNPLKTFSAIENAQVSRWELDGQNHLIQNFSITGTDRTGLFGGFTGSMANVRMVDCAASGGDSTGMLAGAFSGTAQDCGVYLSSNYETMESRVSTCTVTASGTSAGALFGTASGASLVRCFGAADVRGITAAGGLIGTSSGVTVEDSYASGAVTGTSYLGGLLGVASGMGNKVSGSYMTSNVTGTSYAGGVAGKAAGLTVSDTRILGRLRGSTGSLPSTFGPVIGTGSATCLKSGSSNTVFYLTQGSYNAFSGTYTNVSSASFASLAADASNSVDNSHPYAASLYQSAFPFNLIRWTDGEGNAHILDHYGDWPVEVQLQTTLAYYEKYADGTVGYYALTSLTNGTGSETEGSANAWTVNTLQDQVCVEDGYALLTPYPLTSYQYRLNYDLNSKVAAVTVSTMDELSSRVSLVFRSGEQTYTVANAHAFRLPFALQMTERNKAARFYDQLEILGAAVGAHDVLDGLTYTFFYCPDFAMNAINPDLSEGAAKAVCPADPAGSANPIYVRSARQVNALGRAGYYWNAGNGGGNFYFKQTDDIDFGKYVKTYCGQTFNLMDTSSSNIYRNVPIGRPAGQTFTRPNGTTYQPSQFTNTYDGGGRQIIDYCCVTYSETSGGVKGGYQFTGLFGEIKNATIKNVILRASDPANSSGYVETQFFANNKKDKRFHPGVGALVGLLYAEPGGAGNNSTLVENCVVSGYTVRCAGYDTSASYYDYTSSSTTPGSAILYSAMGGIAGYSFGIIRGCSVTNTTLATVDGRNGCYVGGIAGSLNGLGSIVNSYSSAAVKFQSGSGNYAGGIAGGFENIYGYGQTNAGQRKQTIQNCYTYADWTAAGVNGADACAVARQTSGVTLTITNCYYLTGTAAGVTLGGTALTGVSGKTYSQLAALTISGFGKASAANSHPYSTQLTGKAYPFPASVKSGISGTGDYVHYGDWPISKSGRAAYVAYYEFYGTDENRTVGYYTSDTQDGAPVVYNTLDTTNAKTIITSGTYAPGYGLLCRSDDFTAATQASGSAATGAAAHGAALQTGIQIEGQSYTLYPFSTALQSSITATVGWTAAACSELTLTEGGTSRSVWVAPKFVAVSPDNYPTEVQIRTQKQLENLSGYNGDSIQTFRQTHNISLSGFAASLTNYWNWVYDGNGHTITGLTVPLFGSGNGGTLKNIRLLDVAIDVTGPAAPLLLGSNGGTVQNCCAVGSVKGTENAAGLVLKNDSAIIGSYANCTVISGGNYTSASGLALSNNGTIQNCYALGAAICANGYAAGFIDMNWGSISNSYAAAWISGAYPYGFSYSSSGLTNCCWVNVSGLSSYGWLAPITDAALQSRAAALGSAWAKDTDGSHTALFASSGKIYPYPYLVWQLDGSTANVGMHYGPFGNSRIGVAVSYSSLSGWYARGQVADCMHPGLDGVPLAGSSSYYVPQNYLFVLLTNDLSISDYTVAYQMNAGGQTGTLTMTAVSGIGNTDGYTVYYYDFGSSTPFTSNGTGKRLNTVTITSKKNAADVYTFAYQYNSGYGTFTYTPRS